MLKRAFDIATSIALLILLLPIMSIVALLVRVNLGRPILFRQMRPGLGTRNFELLKFRTMLDAIDSAGHFLPDEQRLTPFGRLLRSTSLDELPELWNVLKGEMSLVGPRPLLVEYLARYSPRQARRHSVRPGITGWAQVSGRNSISWEEKFELDIWYIEHMTFLLDLYILCKTAWNVLARRGIAADDHATMPIFEGRSDTDGHS
jgi:lipopolysaccharide/colanic/teichoic acid biosynthesis glycosyltransferase